MNDRNLIPVNKRSKSEAREISRQGGIKSGEARRKKKQVKQLITDFLQSEPEGMETVGLFIDEGTTRAALLVEALYNKAKQGDVKAFETIMKYAGEDPDQKRKDAELKLKRELVKIKQQKFEMDVEDLNGIWGDIDKDDDDGKVVMYLPEKDPEP